MSVLAHLIATSVKESESVLTSTVAYARCQSSSKAGWLFNPEASASYSHLKCGIRIRGGHDMHHCTHGKDGQLRCCLCLTILFDNANSLARHAKQLKIQELVHVLYCKLLTDELGL